MSDLDPNWLPIPYFPSYRASRFGVIEHVDGGIVKQRGDGRGYLCVTLYEEGKPYTKKVHRLVWAAQNRARIPLGKHIDHIDHDKHNNSADNLRLRDASENSADCKKTSRKGARVLIREQRRMVATLAVSNFGTKAIADLCGIGETTVRRIKKDANAWLAAGDCND